MAQDERMEQISTVQSRYVDELMQKRHVVGVAVGLARVDDVITDELALVVMVDEKVPLEKLAPEDHIPRELEGVRVDVQEVGPLQAF